jgi:hypothetical protein
LKNVASAERQLQNLDKALVNADELPAGVPFNRRAAAAALAESDMAPKAFGIASKVGKGAGALGIGLGVVQVGDAIGRGNRGDIFVNSADLGADLAGLTGPLGGAFSAGYAVGMEGADLAWKHSEGFRNFELALGGGIVKGLKLVGVDLLK